MTDNKDLLETVRDYEIRIYNESRTLHLHYPISGTLFRAEQFADIVGRRHAEKQKPGDTVTVMICREINGKVCAIWHRKYPDPATRQIIEINETYQHAAEPDNKSSVSP